MLKSEIAELIAMDDMTMGVDWWTLEGRIKNWLGGGNTKAYLLAVLNYRTAPQAEKAAALEATRKLRPGGVRFPGRRTGPGTRKPYEPK